MNKRYYNIFFNTHTISGIVISVGLYIIFFAGGFSLFRNEIVVWEDSERTRHTTIEKINFDEILQKLDEEYDLTGRDLSFKFAENNNHILVSLNPTKDSLGSDKAKEFKYFALNMHNYKTKTYDETYGLGEFLYRLHFFYQIPTIGLYIAGLISFFFLFAILTGIIVHWKKIALNFYYFNPKIKLKRIWTDTHTALGIIGIPFQLIYAVSGALLSVGTLAFLGMALFYNGDQNRVKEILKPDVPLEAWISKTTNPLPSYNSLTKKATIHWDNFKLKKGEIKNYNGENMKYIFTGEISEKERIVGIGRLSYGAFNNSFKEEKSPHKVNYIEDSQRLIRRLHYGDFGGLMLKLIYFVLSMVTCFVIISGVLIWVEARNKKSKTVKQRLYTAKIGHIYLAISLSMLPVTALAFIFTKTFNTYNTPSENIIKSFYFIVWLIFTIALRFKRDNYWVNKFCLLLTAILGLLIPIVNGIFSGQWLWVSIKENLNQVLFIDLLWIGISLACFFVFFKIKPSVKEQSTFHDLPLPLNKK